MDERKPCEYCGADLPRGVDKRTRQIRGHHFSVCEKRLSLIAQQPVGEISRSYGRCSVTGPAEDVNFVLRNLPDIGDVV